MSLFSIATIIIMVVTACEANGNCRKTERNIEEGRKCRKSCTTNSDCAAANKLCGCDGACGMSCFNPSAMCASLPPIENGNFSVTNMRIGGNVTYTCNEGFGIRGGRIRICRADKRWYPNAPLCENFAICGRSWPKKESSFGRVFSGKNADKNAWPWQVLVTRSSSSMKESLESNNLLGGGTILNQRWVLTAAHVFRDVKTVSNWPRNTVIFAGINERPAPQEEVDESVEAYSINKYCEHDGFNAATYINDIALIEVGYKLDQYLQPIETEALGFTYGYHIKPVCLPCAGTCSNKTYHNAVSAEDSNFLTEEQNPSETEVIVTGFGHTLKRRHNAGAAMLIFNPPRVLQQTSLRIANNITCERGIRAIENKLSSRLGLRFTESMLCSEPSDADACEGDSGGPLVQKMTDENSGEARWVQVGIVSFGYGCGSTDPGYYTKVAEFIAWINETMKEKFCDSPTPPRNGIILPRNPEERDYGTPITYQCNIGFKLEGNDTGTCEDDGSWGQVPNCALDPDCDFEDSSKPTCGFSYDGKRWERIRVMNDGLPGYVIEGKYRWSKLISANIPRDWSDGNTLCLKFRYKLLNYESSLRISSTNIYYHTDIYWSIRRNETLDVWHDFSRNIRTDRAIQYQFEVITPSVQLDDIVVSKGTCDFCQKRPCQNGGNCTSSRNGHTCSCRVGFTGSNCEIAESETKLDLMILIPGFRPQNQQDRTAYKDWLKALGNSIIPSHKYMMSIYLYGEKYLDYNWRHLFEDKLYLDGLSVAQFQSNIDSLNLAQPHAYPFLWSRTITSAGATTWGGRKKSGWSKILVIFVERTIGESLTNELASLVTCMQYNGISVYFIGVTSYRVNLQTFKSRLQAISGSITGEGNLQFVELSQNGIEGSIQAITEYIEKQRTSCPRKNSSPQYDNWECRWEILAKETFHSGDRVFLECKYLGSGRRNWMKWQRHNLCKTDGTWTMMYTAPCEEGNSN